MSALALGANHNITQPLLTACAAIIAKRSRVERFIDIKILLLGSSQNQSNEIRCYKEQHRNRMWP